MTIAKAFVGGVDSKGSGGEAAALLMGMRIDGKGYGGGANDDGDG